MSSYRLVCYYTNWSQYRPGHGKFIPSNIDPNLCTHLNYAFAAINEANELVTVEFNDEKLYKSFNGLKFRSAFLTIKYKFYAKISSKSAFHRGFIYVDRNPSLKTLLAVGGWNFGTQK